MLRTFVAAVAVCFASFPAFADRADDLDRLYTALGLPEMVEVMRLEGVDYGADMSDQLFPGRGGPGWQALVEKIYDPAMMGATVRAALDKGLSDDDLELLNAFFTSERGTRIIGFEVSARQAMIDEGIEEAAEERFYKMLAEDEPRLELITEFVEVNDLVASNVMGAMNSNFAFYQGLIDGEAFPGTMTEGDILADVWAQEDAIRADTETWVYSYLTMAYQPLEDSDLEAYIAMSETEAGQRLNRALFKGFDDMYVAISRALGVAAAQFMLGEDI